MRVASGFVALALFALVLLGFGGARSADIAFPALTGRVVDDAGILPPGDVAALTAKLAAHEQRTGQQVVVATVKSLQGQAIDTYGYQLGRAWGIGQKGKNTGAILLVAPTERKVRIEVGYGLEGALTDAISSTIITGVILPRFRGGDIPGGVVAGADAMLRVLGDDIADEPATAPIHAQRRPQPGGHGSIFSILLTFLIFGVFMWAATRRGGGMGSAILPLMIAGSWGGGGRRSDSGGSGFSGGGGSFGGGGASGSW